MDRSDDSNKVFGLSRDARQELARRLKGRHDPDARPAPPLSPLAPVAAVAAAIPVRHYRFECMEGHQELVRSHAIAARLGVGNPYFRQHQGVARDTTVIDGQVHLNFATYNYLDLCGHPEVSRAAKDAIDRYGTSASASRLVSGERPIHRQLEEAIASLLGCEACVVMVGGHATNVTTIGHLLGPRDLIVHDSLIHNSVAQGAVLSGARRIPFPHNDVDALERLLEPVRHDHERTLIVTEGHFSMDGDVPPLPRLIDVKNRYRALLMVDEAHSLGVVGPRGRGVAEHFGVDPGDVDIWMGTLSKTLAGCGGYIAGSSALVEMLKFTAPGFVYSVGMAPPLAAASLAALEMLRREPERVTVLHERAGLFLALCRDAGLDTGLSQGFSIVPVIIGSSHRAVVLSNRLFERRINVQPIIAPAVEERSARLRFFISSAHSQEQIRTAVQTLVEELEKLR